EAIDIQRVMVAHALGPLAHLEQVVPIFGLASMGDQKIKRLTLGRFVVGVIGATQLERQRFVVRIGKVALDVFQTALFIAVQIIGLGHDFRRSGIQRTQFLEGLGVGDHALVILGVVVV